MPRDYISKDAICPKCGATGVPDNNAWIEGIPRIYDCPECHSFWKVNNGKVTIASDMLSVRQAKLKRKVKQVINKLVQ